MARNEFDDFDRLRGAKVPAPDPKARERAMAAAMQAFDESENFRTAPQGTGPLGRLTDRTIRFWREMMQKKLVAMPALAGLVALPLAGYATWQVMDERHPGVSGNDAVVETPVSAQQNPAEQQRPVSQQVLEREAAQDLAPPAAGEIAAAPLPSSAPMGRAGIQSLSSHASPKMMAPASGLAMPEPIIMPQENRERFGAFETNPLRSAMEDPVSTFSIDVDTASYAFVRRSLKEGVLPDADSVRVEEMINYFPYDWPGPEDRSTPFNTTITVMPTPWNDGTRLMHVAIEGYDVEQAEKPRSNLVFLIDTSGSMNEADKLPLLRNSFRLLVDRLDPQDKVSIVTYAGSAGTALEPTRAADKDKILAALDNLQAGGGTAGEAGLREAYRLAEESFVEGGVNRVMLATDGDFNIGQTSDEDLERLIEEKRETGVFLSVLGFGRGNLNDAMMQRIAQNGNGVAAYIDTLSEAEKVLVEEASSTLFPIAKDVKIQVEFNPERIAEYRLIGYETRTLNRQDFNNDRVDAGEIGSGHSVTAIYEITPTDSPARMVDDLRYGTADREQGGATSDELAFVKLRYKAPDGDTSRLIETAVTGASAVPSFDAAGQDVRFSVAVSAFGQKLRGADAVAEYGYDRIMDVANGARGADPFGYRAEFLSLMRLASALDRAR